MNKTKYSVLIVTDETTVEHHLVELLSAHVNSARVLGTAKCVPEATELIKSHKPHLIFLDIDICENKGFDIFDTIPNRDFELIAMSSHQEFELVKKALQLGAKEYLLKPFSLKDLQDAIAKVEKLIIPSDSIKVPNQGEIISINLSEIIAIEAQGAYCTLHLVDFRKILVSRTLKAVAENVKHLPFFRTHSKFHVHLSHITKVERAGRNTSIQHVGGLITTISQRKLAGFLNEFRRYQSTKNSM